ncbi:MAG: hypothetical protein ACREBW_04265, partial [Candidatus Micrarchaeaceae archaeon]
MWLSIDQKKIADQVAEKLPAYVVTPCNMEFDIISYDTPTADVYSVTLSMPPELERARERVL